MTPGDKGRTTIGKKIFSKDDPLLEAVGTLDELSSFIGLARAKTRVKREKALLREIQKDLGRISAALVCCGEGVSFSRVEFLEKKIASWEKKIPKQESFVYPGENELSALLHICRTVARRGERRVVFLGKKKTSKEALSYLNRLSKFFFVFAAASAKIPHG